MRRRLIFSCLDASMRSICGRRESHVSLGPGEHLVYLIGEWIGDQWNHSVGERIVKIVLSERITFVAERVQDLTGEQVMFF